MAETYTPKRISPTEIALHMRTARRHIMRIYSDELALRHLRSHGHKHEAADRICEYLAETADGLEKALAESPQAVIAYVHAKHEEFKTGLATAYMIAKLPGFLALHPEVKADNLVDDQMRADLTELAPRLADCSYTCGLILAQNQNNLFMSREPSSSFKSRAIGVARQLVSTGEVDVKYANHTNSALYRIFGEGRTIMSKGYNEILDKKRGARPPENPNAHSRA